MFMYICIAWLLFGVFNWLVMFPFVYKYTKVNYGEGEVFLGFIVPPIIIIVALTFLLIRFDNFSFSNFSKKLWKL